ncbi:MAG: hypothetical protein LBQ46_06690 [Treponema sp.]|jgi:hypothetical protein|nr:hypothetical protein [Treponema sp.]
MVERIFHLEIAGRRRLGFDTGLSPQAFAQAKLAQFITQEGSIILPGGETLSWQPGGVIERNGTMVVWGPNFEGERLDRLLAGLNAGPQRLEAAGRALEALGRWIAAYPAGGGSLWPAGVFIALGAGGLYPPGTVFFPPERLRLRSVQAEGDEAWLDGGESLVCRDLAGEDAAAFTAAAMLYRILAARGGEDAALPFPARDKDLLHQDMREAVFLPLRFAAPGLDPQAAELVDRAITGPKAGKPPGRRPSLRDLAGLLETAEGRPRALNTFFQDLGAGEEEKLWEDRERFEKRRKVEVGTRRFVVRNTAILAGIAAALVITVLIVNSIIASNRDRPNTAGMDSRQVVETYYGAFGELDHMLMEACVTGKAGKGDIDMVTRYFVTAKVRQAYEYSAASAIAAKDWFQNGAPPVPALVFGVTDLAITRLAGDETGDETHYRTEYILWVPGAGDEDTEGSSPITAIPGPESPEAAEDFIPPRGYSFTDELTLTRLKGNWQISRIDRQYR